MTARNPEQKQLVVYGISRWTNASRPAARHLPSGDTDPRTGVIKPLCGGGGRKAFSWEYEYGAPTCERCMALAEGGAK